MRVVSGSAAAVSGALALLVFGFLFSETLPFFALHPPHHLLSDDAWAPRDGLYGLWPMVVGSVVVVVLALTLSTPVGLAVGVTTALLAPAPVARVLRFGTGVVAGVPSVVFGYWGLTVLVPILNTVQPPGVSVLAGALVLALMMVPTMAVLSDAALRAVPTTLLRQVAALGVSPIAVVTQVALPAARRGLMGAVLLQVARALGETMAVIMVMGNSIQLPGSVFDSARTLTSHIALEMAYALGDHRRALFAAALLLMASVAVVVLFAERLRQREAS